jgi:hypothetical protein
MAHVTKAASLFLYVLLVVSVSGCASGPPPTSTTTPSLATVLATASPLNIEPTDNPLPAPTTYSAVCDLLASTCATQAAPAGGLPPAMVRPLTLPAVSPGTRCPTSAGAKVNTVGFGGVALGINDPVRPLGSYTIDGVAASGRAQAGAWFGPKTIWYVVPSYQGPVLIRGKRLDGSGPVGFGEQPTVSALIIPPGPTLNEASDGYRTSPGGTWVMSSGCYGVQVDGMDFSYVIVFAVSSPS